MRQNAVRDGSDMWKFLYEKSLYSFFSYGRYIKKLYGSSAGAMSLFLFHIFLGLYFAYGFDVNLTFLMRTFYLFMAVPIPGACRILTHACYSIFVKKIRLMKGRRMKRSLFYASTMLMWGLPAERWFRTAAEEELGGLEIWIQQMDYQGITPEKIKNLSRYYGVSVTAHSYSWDVNLISMCREMRTSAILLTRKALREASFFHAGCITVHPGKKGLPIPGVNYDRILAESVSSVTGYGAEQGIAVSFEIMEKIHGELLISADEVQRMEPYRDLSGARYTLDTAHCENENEILSTAQRLRGKIAEFHVSNKKGIKRHIQDIAGGDLNLGDTVPQLSGYGVPLVLEGYDPSLEAKALHCALSYFDDSQ